MTRYHVDPDTGEEVLHPGCAAYLADQVRGLHSADVIDLIAAAMRAEGAEPRTNGEMVTRLIDFIADLIDMQPHRAETESP
jgi:hypothetical protein